MLASPEPPTERIREELAALGPRDIETLLEKLSYHRIEGLAHGAVRELNDGSDLGSRLRERHARIRSAAISQGLAVAGALDALRAAGVPAIFLRGLRIAESAYGDAGSRPFEDHDLLLRARDVPVTSAILRSLRFREERRGFFRRGGTIIDLHTDPLGACRRPSRLKLLHLNGDDLFERAEWCVVAGSPVLAPSPEDDLLLVAMHVVKHSFDRLIRTADLAHLLAKGGRPVDWPALRRRARATRTAGLLAWALEAAGPLGVPACPIDRPMIRRGIAPWLVSRARDLRPLPFCGEVLMALGAPSTRAALGFLLEALAPEDEVPPGVFSSAAAIPRRAASLMRQAGRQIRQEESS